MTETELGIEGVEKHIDALDALAHDDVNTKLRVGLGRQMVASNRGSFKGIWEIISPLIALADHADDPMAQTTLWANGAYLCIARADYDRAAALARRAFDACERFRLDFARGYCIGYLALAEIGQRRFRTASARLRDLAALAEAQDNSYMRLMHIGTSLRLALSKGAPEQATRLAVPFDDTYVPPASRGELLGLLAIANAAQGDAKVARSMSEDAVATTNAVEASLYAAATHLIISASSSALADLSAQAKAFLKQAQDADFLDAFVTTYRAYPPILGMFSTSSTPSILHELLWRARDTALARQFGLDIGVRAEGATTLTKRELEVLALLGQGLTNAQIAQKLVITQSTVKVHVHHILQKLGVRTRLQAALAAQERLADLS